MLSPAPATLQHGRDTDRADTEVSSLPGAGRAQTRAAGGLSGALTRDYGSKLRSGHPALGSVQCHHTAGAGLACQRPAAGILMCKN